MRRMHHTCAPGGGAAAASCTRRAVTWVRDRVVQAYRRRPRVGHIHARNGPDGLLAGGGAVGCRRHAAVEMWCLLWCLLLLLLRLRVNWLCGPVGVISLQVQAPPATRHDDRHFSLLQIAPQFLHSLCQPYPHPPRPGWNSAQRCNFSRERCLGRSARQRLTAPPASRF